MLGRGRIMATLCMGVVAAYVVVISSLITSQIILVEYEYYYQNQYQNWYLESMTIEEDESSPLPPNENCHAFPTESLVRGRCAPLIAWIAPRHAGVGELSEDLVQCHPDMMPTTLDDDGLWFPFDHSDWQHFARDAVFSQGTTTEVGQARIAPHRLYRLDPLLIARFRQELPHTVPVLVLRDPRELAYEHYLAYYTYEHPTFESYLQENFRNCNWAARAPGDYHPEETDWITATLYKISIIDMAIQQGVLPEQFHVDTPLVLDHPERFEAWNYAQVFHQWSEPPIVIYEAETFDLGGKQCRHHIHHHHRPMSDQARSLLTRIYKASVQALPQEALNIWKGF